MVTKVTLTTPFQKKKIGPNRQVTFDARTRKVVSTELVSHSLSLVRADLNCLY
jgi:hypothetical protein